MSNKPPIGVPQGAIRFNTDSQKLEFYAQDRWVEMATDSPTLDGGVGRGFVCGGNVPGARTNVIDFMSFSTGGNAMDYGDLTDIRSNLGAGSNGHGGI